jgi:hypothetical protein
VHNCGHLSHVEAPQTLREYARHHETGEAIPDTLIERLTGGDVRLDLIDGGDHRLSSSADLARLVAAVEGMRD